MRDDFHHQTDLPEHHHISITHRSLCRFEASKRAEERTYLGEKNRESIVGGDDDQGSLERVEADAANEDALSLKTWCRR